VALYNRGTAREQLGDLEGSVADLTEAIELAGRSGETAELRLNLHCNRV
jgi:hypothetical protein